MKRGEGKRLIRPDMEIKFCISSAGEFLGKVAKSMYSQKQKMFYAWFEMSNIHILAFEMILNVAMAIMLSFSGMIRAVNVDSNSNNIK